MGRAGRRRAEALFGADRIVSQYERFYEKVMSRRRTWTGRAGRGPVSEDGGARLMWTAFVRDLRYAVRISLRDLGFTLVAATTLGLAIGTSSGVFSLIDAVIMRPLPVRAPEELVVVFSPSAGGGGLSYPDYQDYRRESEVLADLAAYTWTTVGLASRAARPGRSRRSWSRKTTSPFSASARPWAGPSFRARTREPLRRRSC